MRPVLIAFTVLAAGAAFAQAQSNNASGCPVGMTARHQGSPAAIWTTSLEDAQKSPAKLAALHSGVHVDLNAPHKEIKQAELAVFYLPPGTRALPVTGSQFAPSQNPAPETHKNFSLAAGSASHLLAGDLLLGPVASVTHITLTRITYSDGSEWNAPSSSSCSVAPSKFMQVNTK